MTEINEPFIEAIEPHDPDIEVEDEITEAFRPALTINIHTWATPIFTAVALVVGLLGGYFARPLLEARSGQAAGQTAAAEAAPAAAAPSITQQIPDVAASANDEVSKAEMMDFLVSQTRHFKGDPDAEVTLIEFSDFL